MCVAVLVRSPVPLRSPSPDSHYRCTHRASSQRTLATSAQAVGASPFDSCTSYFRIVGHSATARMCAMAVCVCVCIGWQRLRARDYMCQFRDCMRAATAALSLVGRRVRFIQTACAPLSASRAIRWPVARPRLDQTIWRQRPLHLRQFIVCFACCQ